MFKILKKMFQLVIIAGLLINSLVINAIANERIKVLFDEKEIVFDVEPIFINDRVMVPMRTIFEKLGAKVEWDSNKNMITATKGENKIIISIDNKEASVNGQVKSLDVAAIVINDRTLVPIRFISESFGISVRWNEDISTVIINSKIQYKQIINTKTPSLKYEGEVVNGIPNGYGREYQGDKLIYEGEWHDGKRYGQGKTYYNNIIESEGEFDGDLVKGKAYYSEGKISIEKDLNLGSNGYSGTVKRYYPDGKILMIAEVVNNLPTNNTVYYYKDGSIAYQGEAATKVTYKMLSELIWGNK